MGTVRDPDFWRRFSRAVHQDDAQKYTEAQDQAEKGQKQDIKHSYVFPSTRRTTSSPTSPSSVSPLKPAMVTVTNPEPLSPLLFTPLIFGDVKEHSIPMFSRPTTPRKPKTPTSTIHPLPLPSTSPLNDINLVPSSPLSPPRRPRPTHSSHSFTSHRNTSQLTLGFSGRPHSRFKFWTQISSDPSNRSSWLESQRKKKRQRTWICWVFWLSLLGLIAAVVVVILFLRGKGII